MDVDNIKYSLRIHYTNYIMSLNRNIIIYNKTISKHMYIYICSPDDKAWDEPWQVLIHSS